MDAPFTYELVAGGRSNLTYKVTAAGGAAVALRRPPTGHVLPTAHNVVREHRVISGLWPTPVPVPEPLACCEDLSVTGAPFFVMGYVDGRIIRNGDDAERLLDVPGRRKASWSLIDTLAELHAVDVDAAGLGDLGPRDGYIERQLRRWIGQYEASVASVEASALPRPGRDALLSRHGGDPVVLAHGRLESAVPQAQRLGMVHGDYRLDNMILDGGGTVIALLDWEICALGDPLADVGLLMVYWASSPRESLLVADPATAVDGFPSRTELLERYASASGTDLSEIAAYTAFGYWKLACILEGVYSRYVGGAGGGDPSGVESFSDIACVLGERALQVLDTGQVESGGQGKISGQVESGGQGGGGQADRGRTGQGTAAADESRSRAGTGGVERGSAWHSE